MLAETQRLQTPQSVILDETKESASALWAMLDDREGYEASLKLQLRIRLAQRMLRT